MKTIELIGAERLGRRLSHAEREVFPKAAARALNRTAVTIRKESVRAIAQHMGMKQKPVRDRTRIQRAQPKPAGLTAVLTFRGRAFNLIRFKARQTKRGVSAAPFGARKIFPHTFIATIRSNPGVFVRTKQGGRRVGRTPIRGVLGPGVARTASEAQISAERRASVAKLVPERLERELKYYMRRLPG